MEQETVVEQSEGVTGWKRHFTTVTPFSKFLALYLFIMLPIVGFWAGYAYAPVSVVGKTPGTTHVINEEVGGDIIPLPGTDIVPVDPDLVDEANGLVVTPRSGTAPLTVTLTAPEAVMKKMIDCTYTLGWYGASGNGLSVMWGDEDGYEPQNTFLRDEENLRGKNCSDVVMKHTYTEPGTYTVRVTSWYPGPTDAPVNEWMGTQVITVKAPGEVSGVYMDDEGVFELVLNTDTVKRFTGIDSWTREPADYYYTEYQDPFDTTKQVSLRISDIDDFVYDPGKDYVIKVEQKRSPTTYGALDVGWYDYRLVEVVTVSSR